MDPRNHTGLVVYADCLERSDYHVYALDLDILLDTGMPLVLRLHERAFHAYPEDYAQSEEGELKRAERKRNRPLNFGDVIDWSVNTDVAELEMESVIVRFSKKSNKNLVYFPSRWDSQKGVNQVLLNGVINPNDPAHLFTEYFPTIPIPVEKQHCAWPNVYLKAWVTMKFDIHTKRLLVEVDSFKEVLDYVGQIDVANAPWNKNNDKYSLIRNIEEQEEEEEDGCVSVETDMPLEIYAYEAVRTGNQSVLLWKLPGCRAVLPLREKNIVMKPGECYHVDAVWNSYEKTYMINHITSSRSSTSLPATESGLLRVSVKENEAIRGLFENELLGPIDDPKGILKFLHLSPLAKNAIPLVVSDGFPSRGSQFRFHVEDIHGDKKKKLANWIESAEIKVGNASGVVVNDREVFSAAHSPMFFKFSKVDDSPPIGTFVTFSAIFDKETEQFRITEWRRDNSKEPLRWVNRRMDQKNPNKEQPVFYVSGKVPTHKKIKEILLTDEFGLIDDNLMLLQFDPKSLGKKVDAWVTVAHYSSDDPFVGRTVFQVVGARMEEPEERVMVCPTHSEDKLVIEKTLAKLEALKKAFQSERGPSVDKTTERVPSRAVSSVSTSSIAPSVSSVSTSSHASSHAAPGPTVPIPPASLPPQKGLFASHARSIRSESSQSTRSESFATCRSGSTNGWETACSNVDDIGGESEGARTWREKKQQAKIEPYTGAVLMPEGSKIKYDILETIKRIRFSFDHGKCGLHCEEDCPWLTTISQLTIDAKGFWDECMTHFPTIASAIMESYPEMHKKRDC